MYSHLAVIETESNQSFIFSTNRLREIVGASEMIYRGGVDVVLEACGFPAEKVSRARSADGLRSLLMGGSTVSLGNGIEPLFVASGRSVILGDERGLEKVISKVTKQVLDEMPGVTVRGAIARVDEWTPTGLDVAMRTAVRRLKTFRSTLPSNDLRFQRIPFVEECRSSGLPASRTDQYAGVDAMKYPVSEPVLAKRKFRKKGWSRLREWMASRLTENMDQLEENLQGRDARWVAVIHADGNGMGQIFADFSKRCKAKTADDYIESYRSFSLAIQDCTLNAARQALSCVWPDGHDVKGFIPLVLGGDDLTAICDGAHAVPFAFAYLKAFERETSNNEDIRRLLDDDPCLSAAAGIAIVKPHFPFYRAYQLAEALTSSAKQTKYRVRWKTSNRSYPCSALHYHVNFDSSGADWDRIVEKGANNDGDRLSIQPWIVSDISSNVEGFDWVRQRSIRTLWAGIEALSEKDDDGRLKLPRSQQHALRDGLFLTRQVAQGRLNRIRSRYDGVFRSLLPESDGKELFVSEDGRWVTSLLDLMDLADVGARQPTCREVGE